MEEENSAPPKLREAVVKKNSGEAIEMERNVSYVAKTFNGIFDVENNRAILSPTDYNGPKADGHTHAYH